MAAEIGFNFGLLSGKIGSKASILETRVARLLVVERHIRQHEPIGTTTAPLKWMEGYLQAMSLDVGAGALLYVADGPTWRLALAGSATHLAGGAAPDSVSVPFSFLPRIASHLKTLDEQSPQVLNNVPEGVAADYLGAGTSQSGKAWFQVIEWCLNHRLGTPQQIGFLAKRLVTETSGERPTTIASPLYIELLD
ncbi:MAG TPA: SAVMC3_10250 family protein [Candidatus Acidoferrales bacterium]|nr:SAVMC3_10250 family protein [Candidatus Acidoferrales bacterium]